MYYIRWRPNQGYEYETLASTIVAILYSLHKIFNADFGGHVYIIALENLIAITALVTFFIISMTTKNYLVYKVTAYLAYAYLLIRIIYLPHALLATGRHEQSTFLFSWLILLVSVFALTKLFSSYIKLAVKGAERAKARKRKQTPAEQQG